MTMRPVIEVRELKTYFRTPQGIGRAVDGVSFSIERGRTLALVGESGCGKSVTALSIIQLIPQPQGFLAGGSILLNGMEITTLKESEKRKIRGNNISMIFQEPMTSLNPVFTVGEQIVEAVMLHQGRSRREARAVAIEMLDRVHLPSPERIFNEYPHRLSGGMRQRVMIAIALSCRPDLLIADEPTTALDVTIQEEILDLIKEMREEMGMAVLFISHNLAVVYQNAEEVGVMYGGKIVEKAPTGKIFRNPMHPYTLKLLRSIPGMEKRGRPLDTIPGTVPPPTEFPPGCRFSGRCDRELDLCRTTEPPLVERDEGHLVACHLYKRSGVSAPVAEAQHETAGGRARLDLPHRERPVLLEVRGLKCYYPVKKGVFKRTVDHVRAVDGIDLTVREGSTLALVGESGCGKTTAGKAILQLLRPTAGEVLFEGKDLCRLGPKELKPLRSLVQIIFQDPYSALNPRLMVGQIIEEGLKSLKPGMTRQQRADKVAATLEMVGLTPDMMHRYPHEFSGGQRQRIGIARVLAVDPRFIVCDEATSALDVSVQAQILNLLKSIQRDFGLSFLFITHDLGVVEYIADEVAVMHNGRIVECGTVEDIFTSPRDPYTKRLLSAVPRIEEGPDCKRS